jgi:hypothetical protein
VDSTLKPSFEQCSSPQTGADAENTLPGLKPGSMGSDALIDKQDEAVDGDDYSAEESNDEDEVEGVDENEEDSDVDENGDDYEEDDYDEVPDDDVDEDPNDREDDDDDDDYEDVDKEDENDEDEDEDEDGEEGEDEEWVTDVKVVSEANPLNGVPPRKMPQPARGMGVTSSTSQSAKSHVREIEGKNNKVSVTDAKIHGERDTKWVPKSSWNSLICPDGHLNFSLKNLTGSMKPDKGSTHGKTSIKHLGKTTQSPEGSKSRKVLGEKRHRSGGVEGPRSEAKKRSDGSSFLKSAVAEGEWVASKSELQVEIKVKHKVAVPSTKKLGGPGSARK